MSLQKLPSQSNVLFSEEFKLIRKHYGNRVAKRSQLPLINHILEGLDMMDRMSASQEAKKAFCLHPLIQDDRALEKNWEKTVNNPNVCRESLSLAMKYSSAANAYMCWPSTDNFTLLDLKVKVGPLNQDLIHMLVADKIQNEKDFEIHHKKTHHRSKQLARYYDLWLQYLDICEAELPK